MIGLPLDCVCEDEMLKLQLLFKLDKHPVRKNHPVGTSLSNEERKDYLQQLQVWGLFSISYTTDA